MPLFRYGWIQIFINLLFGWEAIGIINMRKISICLNRLDELETCFGQIDFVGILVKSFQKPELVILCWSLSSPEAKTTADETAIMNPQSFS